MNFLIIGLLLLPAAHASPTIDRCSMTNEGGAQGAIVERVCRGLALRDEYRLRVDDEIEARKQVTDAPIGSEERHQLLLKWEVANALLESKRDAMNKALNGAIEDTLRHYTIAPMQGDGDIKGGPGINLSAAWKPTYQHRPNPDDPIFRKAELANGQDVYVRWDQGRDKMDRSYAVTWFDGQVDVMDGVLEDVLASRTPRVLAFLLHHESVHFDQLREGKWSTLNAREVAAYRVSIADAKRFGLSQIEIQGLRDHLSYNQRKLEKQRNGEEAYPLNLPPAKDQADNKIDWEKMVDEESRRIALSLNLTEERRNRAEASTPDSGNAPADTRSPLDSIESLAKYFCENPQYIRSLTRAHEVWRDALPKVPSILVVLDLDYRFGTMNCAQYVALQAIYLHRNHCDAGAVSAILGLVDEGLVRQTQSTPRGGRVSLPPVTPGQTPDPLPIPTDPPSPDAIDLPRDRTPSIPHCRYHDWCKEPGK